MTATFIDVAARRRRNAQTGEEWGDKITVYDAIVERWNTLRPLERQARSAECKTRGHDWAPLSWGPNVCKRCLRYDGAE